MSHSPHYLTGVSERKRRLAETALTFTALFREGNEDPCYRPTDIAIGYADLNMLDRAHRKPRDFELC